MSHLLALLFDDPYKADEARAARLRLAGEGDLELTETALISKPANGKTRVSQDVDIVSRDQSVGHLAGLVTNAVIKDVKKELDDLVSLPSSKSRAIGSAGSRHAEAGTE